MAYKRPGTAADKEAARQRKTDQLAAMHDQLVAAVEALRGSQGRLCHPLRSPTRWHGHPAKPRLSTFRGVTGSASGDDCGLGDRDGRAEVARAEAGSWPSIQVHGLLSTSALLDLFEISGADRDRIESWRPESVMVDHPVHGTAVIRDNKPAY